MQPPQINYIICQIFQNIKLLNVNRMQNTMVCKWQYMIHNMHTSINAYQSDSNLWVWNLLSLPKLSQVLSQSDFLTECEVFYVSDFQSHDHSSCCPDWTMWPAPVQSFTKLFDDLLLILLTNAQSWFVSSSDYRFSTFHTMAWVIVSWWVTPFNQ